MEMENGISALPMQSQRQSNENEFEKVNQARKMPKVSVSPVSDIKMVLPKIYILIGLRKDYWPTDYERDTIIAYIQNDLSIYSVLDFEIAFRMFVKGELDYQETHFQNFSILFLEKVMQSYRRYQITIPRPNAIAIEEKSSITEDEKEVIAYRSSLKMFEEYKVNFSLYDFGNAVYEYLRTWGLLKQNEEGRIRRLKMARVQLAKEAKEQINGNNKLEISLLLNRIESDEEMVISRAKQIRLMDYFDFLIEKGIELKEVLK